ncbi:hypothetical protein [Calothrix sp. CCY 0018]|uniref:hypothetical protein n=1 Tax=Calothrix sp. CCY 0018 TaxID=3103864 RepID=UPI0039C6A723
MAAALTITSFEGKYCLTQTTIVYSATLHNCLFVWYSEICKAVFWDTKSRTLENASFSNNPSPTDAKKLRANQIILYLQKPMNHNYVL